jgi:hypothetical protein
MTQEEALIKYNEIDKRVGIKPFWEVRDLIEKLGNSQDCKQCKYHLSDNGNFPLEPCCECSLFYGNKWESK